MFICVILDVSDLLSLVFWEHCAADSHANKVRRHDPIMPGKINLPCVLLFQRLRISRHHPGGSLRLSAPQTAPEPHGLHRAAAGSAGEDFPEDPLPGCGDERAAGHVHEPARGPCAGRLLTPEGKTLHSTQNIG